MFEHICYFNKIGSRDTFYKVLISGTREIGIVSTMHKKIISPVLKKYYKDDYKMYTSMIKFFPHENGGLETSNEVHLKMCGKTLFTVLNEEPITLAEYFDIVGYDHKTKKLNDLTINAYAKKLISENKLY